MKVERRQPTPRTKRLSRQHLQAAGVTPGLMTTRYDTTGRARLEQLTAEASRRPNPFLRSKSNSCPEPVEEGD